MNRPDPLAGRGPVTRGDTPPVETPCSGGRFPGDNAGMPPRRRVPVAAGRAALAAWLAEPDADRETVATAVRYTLEELATRAPGRSTEVRVPPYGAVQCIEGLTHRRGTPPNVVETDPQTWLRLATGRLGWGEAEGAGALRVSGTRANLAAHLPVVDAPPDAPREPSAGKPAEGERQASTE